jgi:hypothetical protein
MLADGVEGSVLRPVHPQDADCRVGDPGHSRQIMVPVTGQIVGLCNRQVVVPVTHRLWSL